jgi:hypothetical protein
VTRDVGDRVNARHLVYDAAGALTAATVVLTVTDPSGDVTTPTVTATATGTYDAAFTLSEAGLWSWVWSVSGTVVEVATGSVFASSPAPPVYASVPELKAALGLASSDTADDGIILASLETASRMIDQHCSRIFSPTLTASARTFSACGYYADVDDFWSTTDLVVKTDGGAGTYPTTVTSYRLEPSNGIQAGEAWPYNRVVFIDTTIPSSQYPAVQVTAKWGWASTPSPVRHACLLMASEALKLAREAPFGVAGFGAFGAVRVRDNPRAAAMLAPYVRYPVLVA